MQPMIPIVTSILSCLMRLETINFKKAVSIVVATCGALVVVLDGSTPSSPHKTFVAIDREHYLIGSIMLFFQMFCVSVYFIVIQNVTRSNDPLWLTVYILFIGGMLNLAVFAHYVLTSDHWTKHTFVFPTIFKLEVA